MEDETVGRHRVASGREAGSGSCQWEQGRQRPQTRWQAC